MTGLDVLNPLRVLVRVLLLHMLLQRRVHGKGHVAYLAAVLVVARGAVSLHVAREFARLNASVKSLFKLAKYMNVRLMINNSIGRRHQRIRVLK